MYAYSQITIWGQVAWFWSPTPLLSGLRPGKLVWLQGGKFGLLSTTKICYKLSKYHIKKDLWLDKCDGGWVDENVANIPILPTFPKNAIMWFPKIYDMQYWGSFSDDTMTLSNSLAFSHSHAWINNYLKGTLEKQRKWDNMFSKVPRKGQCSSSNKKKHTYRSRRPIFCLLGKRGNIFLC